MKGRSHRLPSHDMHEDWVNGSWTVDCVCGVNFDDGEEMVNCDECGVWMHTRCSRYVKGEESFACDKCKSKKNKDESEETEVAQLLVELPTKTIRLESSFAATGPATRPFRLWTDMPMEERVHVQGIPGGDPALFTGLSVFTPELWKCAGYVPKKFNFHYREFPCWDEEGSRNEEDHENAVDKGAGVLFSLAKETVFATPAAALVGMRGRSEEGTMDRKMYSKERKNWVNGDNDVSHSQIEVTKERSLLRPIVIHSGKRKKEDLTMPRERSGKKKARATYKEVDLKKRVSHFPKTALTSTSDAKPMDFYEDRKPKSIKNDKERTKNKNLGDSTCIDSESDYNVSVGNGFEKSKNHVSVIERSSKTLSADISRHDYATGVKLNERKATHAGSSKFRNLVASTPENIVQKLPVEREGDNALNGNIDDNVESSEGCDVKPATDGLLTTLSEAKDNQIMGDDNMSSGPLQPNVKSNADDDALSKLLNGQSSIGNTKDIGAPINGINENLKMDNMPLSSSSSGHYKTQETERASEALSDCHASKHTEIASDHLKIKRELEGSEGRTPLQKCFSEPKLGSALPSEPSKSGENTFHSSALPSQNKIVLSLGKSPSASATVMISKSSVSDTARSADNLDSNPSTKQQAPAECNSSIKKDRAASDTVKLKDEDSQDMSRKAAKERLKPTVNSTSKASKHTSIHKRALSDSKDSALHPSSKTSLVQNSSEATGSLQKECPSQVKNKASASGLPLRGEKLNHCNGQSSSKGNHAPSAPPPVTNSSAALSDEELALLLHQELNSSPRVPRVPRVRHAGSMASPSATSMLMKRSSGYGGRDHNLVPRRKNKDAFKDGFARSHEPDDGAKKPDKGPSSPDLGRQDAGCTADELPKGEGIGSLAAVRSVKKNVLSTSASIVNSGLSSSAEINDHHLSSVRKSSRNMSDEETGIVQVPVHRTLPGLINEIMSKGQRMTYEELCNAVLPHWHNLRKHNGERYAYSSHSQAVLDCLRNRHEWAQLVDRGPKTNSSRKRRKLDAEESEDNDYGKGRRVKEGDSKSLESQRDEFPKGKRKARKRRRLALQGRGIKELRRRKADLGSDDDSGPFSNSSDESLLSDDEIRGRGGGPVGSDASASSDETGRT